MLRAYESRHLLLLTLLALLLGCSPESGEQTAQVEPPAEVESAPPQIDSSPVDKPPSVAAPEARPVEVAPYQAAPAPQAQSLEAQPSYAPRSLNNSTQRNSAQPQASSLKPYRTQSAPQMAPAEAAPPPEMSAMEQAPAETPTLQELPTEETAAEESTAQSVAYEVVQVFYATDRNAYAEELSMLDRSQRPWIGILLGAALSMALSAGALLFKARRLPLAFGALLAAVGAGGIYALNEHQPDFASPEILVGEAQQVVGYGTDRGELQLGVCEVSIPPNHQVGKLEAPSILRLEFKENPEKHVVLMSIERRDDDQYFTQLRDTIAHSDRREALVFVHGYNVGFDDAVRRTAQLAHDLRFEGAPICYSWPSQANTVGYTIDENNVVWTVPHLKQFLLEVIDRTEAQSVNLVAHSMGNRALTSAVRELTLELRNEEPLFNEIVLAAPDVDAEVFQRDIAPAMIKAGKRVTLYASSNDQALAASRAVHGYPRAGESGDRLVVVPGVETIDVSAIDTSLLGHNYYGDSSTLLYDMHNVIRYSLPPERRNLLRPSLLSSGMQFWVFQPNYSPIARPAGENVRR